MTIQTKSPNIYESIRIGIRRDLNSGYLIIFLALAPSTNYAIWLGVFQLLRFWRYDVAVQFGHLEYRLQFQTISRPRPAWFVSQNKFGALQISTHSSKWMDKPASTTPCWLQICRNCQFWSLQSNKVIQKCHWTKQ